MDVKKLTTSKYLGVPFLKEEDNGLNHKHVFTYYFICLYTVMGIILRGKSSIICLKLTF